MTMFRHRSRPRRPSVRHILSFAATALTLAAVAAWAVVLRPYSLGGPATYVMVAGQSMEPGLHTGDLVVALPQSSYRDGDVVAYHVPKGEPAAGTLVIHRIIGGTATAGYRLQGDNNKSPDIWRPKPRDIAGKMVVSIPKMARVFRWCGTHYPWRRWRR